MGLPLCGLLIVQQCPRTGVFGILEVQAGVDRVTGDENQGGEVRERVGGAVGRGGGVVVLVAVLVVVRAVDDGWLSINIEGHAEKHGCRD